MYGLLQALVKPNSFPFSLPNHKVSCREGVRWVMSRGIYKSELGPHSVGSVVIKVKCQSLPRFSLVGCEVEILGVRPSYCREYFSVPSDKNFADAINDALESLRYITRLLWGGVFFLRNEYLGSLSALLQGSFEDWLPGRKVGAKNPLQYCYRNMAITEIKIREKDVLLFSSVGYNTEETSLFTIFNLLFQTTSRSVCEYLFTDLQEQTLKCLDLEGAAENLEILRFSSGHLLMRPVLWLLLHFRTSQAQWFRSKHSFCANMNTE